jgi:protein-S-isoprenylcysteine O-methyltransferase Ste14
MARLPGSTAMSWRKFNIELSAWAVKTVLCVLTTLIAIRMFYHMDGAIKNYPLSWRLIAENEWIFPLVMVVCLVTLWLCYWKTMRILRAD